MQSSLVEEIFISDAFHGDAKQIPRAQRPPLPTTKFYYSYLEPGRQPSGEDVSHPIIELALKLLGSYSMARPKSSGTASCRIGISAKILQSKKM